MKNYTSSSGYIISFLIVLGIFLVICIFQLGGFDTVESAIERDGYLFNAHQSSSVGFPFIFIETGPEIVYIKGLLGNILVFGLITIVFGKIMNNIYLRNK